MEEKLSDSKLDSFLLNRTDINTIGFLIMGELSSSKNNYTSSQSDKNIPYSDLLSFPSPLQPSRKNDTGNIPAERMQMSSLHEFIFVLTVCSSQFITLIGAVQGIPQMADIAETFRVTPNHVLELGWCNAAFATTLGSFVIISGKLGDVLGHKLMFVIGYAWLSIWSILTGFSRYSKSNPIFFYFCRGAQGIGASLLTPTSLAILGKTYPECKRKNFIFSFYGACAPWGIVTGLVFSSIFTQLTHWSWTYWTMGIVATIITLLAILFIPNDIVSDSNKGYTFRDFDYIGGFCGISGLILFSIVWNQAPKSTFNSPYIYILLIISVLLMIVAFIVDSKVKDPLIPWKDICHDTIRILVCVFLTYLAFTIWLFYSWRYNLVVKQNTLLLAAAKTIPLAITAFVAATCSALAINAGVPPQIRMLFGLICVCTSSILIGTVTGGQTYWGEIFVSFVFISFGLDIIFPSATLLFSDGVPDELKGISASLVATALNYATSLGPGIATTIVRYRCEECLNRVGPSFTKTIHLASYLAIGASGFGILVAIYGTIHELFIRKNRKFKPRSQRGEVS